jgi:hypothetical protein
MAAYMGTLAQWLLDRPTEVELGWSLMEEEGDREKLLEAGRRLAERGLAGVTWSSLIDPVPRLYEDPPWVLRPGLERIGLLDQGLEPKAWVESWVREILSRNLSEKSNDFIDLGPEAYLTDPHTHLYRLWEQFRYFD